MICVVGSLNVDFIATVQRLPSAGETLPATRFCKTFGGKGANQAIAAARQGTKVRMVGCVGDDSEGKKYFHRLHAEGIATKGITVTKRCLTGSAVIAVDRQGENLIVVAPGANGELTAAMVQRHQKELIQSRILLMQLEVPLQAVVEAARIANTNEIPLVLNPSPLRSAFPWGKYRLDTVIVNKSEADGLFGSCVGTAEIQQKLGKWRVETLIVTRGAQPTVIIGKSGKCEVSTMRVRPIDTVGAGDAFAGVYAAKRANGLSVLEAVRHANCAGALATLKSGAQDSLPTRSATEKALRRLMKTL